MTAIFSGNGSGLERSSANTLGAAGQLGGAPLGRAGENVAVNAATGNVVINRRDEFLAGRGLDIGISRTYNSLAELSDGDNGDQWQQSTTRRVFGFAGGQNATGSTIKRQGADGSSITYTWDSSYSAYVTTDGNGAYDQLKKVGSQWVWTDGATQTTETYSAYGTNSWRIISQKDNDNYGLSFTYSGANLSKVTTANGEWTQYHWSGNNITKVVTGHDSATLTRVYYGYDTQNRLTSVSTDLSERNNSLGSDKYVVNYTYHGSTKRIATISQTDGSSLALTYDGSGRIAMLTQTVASGDTRVTQLAYGSGSTTVTHPDGTTNVLYYDSKKQLTQINYVGAAAGDPVTTAKFAYDSSGNVTSVTDQNGKITAYQYHDSRVDGAGHRGLVTRVTDPNGNQVDRWYDGDNNLKMESVTGSSETTGNAVQYTRFIYDGENHLRYRISASGDVTEYRYTVHGLLKYEIEYPEHGYPTGSSVPTEGQMDTWRNGLTDRSSTKITLHSYDARGNKTRVWSYGYATAAGAASNAEGYSRTYYTFDQAGKLLSTYDGSQIAQNYVYDGMGRVTAATDLAGGTTSFVFQDAATKTVVTTASGHVSTSTYNKAGELINRTNSGSYDTTGTSSYKYDKMGRIRMETDETGFKTYYLYDKLGRKVADINHYGHITEHRYDKAGRVNASVSYAYGVSAANLTTLANPNNTLQMANIRPAGHSYDVWAWTVYDAKGRVIQAIDGAGGTSKLEYDKADRLVKTTSYYNKLTSAQLTGFKSVAPTAQVLPAANGKDSISRVFYDRTGRVVGNLDGEGYLSEVVYDRAGQKVEEIAYAQKTSSSYWASGTFSQLRSSAAPTSSANRRVHHVYDGQGQLRYTVDVQGRVSSFTYNIAGKLTKTVTHAAVISTADFTYDSVKAKVAVIANATNDRTSTINYNTRGQVAYSTDVSGLRTTLTYDNRGQVIKAVVGTGAAARTTRNWYTAQGSLRFTVDAEGYVKRYDYDKEDRLTREVTWSNKITASDSTTIAQINSLASGAGSWTDVRYTYDAAGRRNSMYDGEGNRTVWGWHRTGLLADEYSGYTDGANAVTDRSRTHHVYDGAGRLMRKYAAHGAAESAVSYIFYDGLGNVTSTKDPNGKTTSFTYDEVGRVLSATDAAGGVTHSEYNAFGDLVRNTDPRGNSTYNYYDNLGRTTKTRDAENYVTDMSYTQFGEVANVKRWYNRTTSAASTTTPPTVAAHSKDATISFQYDKRGLVTRSTDAEGHFETFTYDAFGNRITARAKSATTSKVAGGTTTYVYDKRGQLTSETLPVASYTSAGAVAASTVTNTYTYDARGNRTHLVEAQGLSEQRTTQYVYDKANRVKETIGQTFLGKTPREYIYYDARGNITETKAAGGGRTIYFYDDLNRKVVEINAVGTYSKYTYDKNGNVTETRVYETPVGLPANGGALAEAPNAPAGASRITTFTYDNVNRLLTSSIPGATTGYWNGSSWVQSTSAITTTYQYDANGNVVKITDPNGISNWSYYDKSGRKTSQVDGERYRTDWTYDASGNVTREHRYVNQAATPSSVTAPPSVSANGSFDRITDFTYDKVGNRLTEKRLNVLKHNGSGAHVNSHAQITYLFNGLGQVTRKTEATGDQINYTYDAGGRLTEEKRASFVSYNGTVTPEVDYFYNGVGDLSRTVAAGQSGVSARVTTYTYDGGKLRSLTDGEGFTRYFWYDIAGRQTLDYYKRIKSDGTYAANFDGIQTSYDLLGRVAQKYQSTHNGSAWIDSGPRAVTTYNAFGDIKSVAVGGVTQAQNKFDAAGRLWASNSGDGVWKYFGYDKNGNQTVSITSAGYNLTNKTFAQAKSYISRSDVNATYTQYDKRNLSTKVVEEGRQLGGSTQTLNTSRTYNAFGDVLTETNANGATIVYTYNNMSMVIKSVSPTVQITNENGSTQWIKPTEDYYYDASGRLVASRDADGAYASGTATTGGAKTANTGNLTKLTLLAGTGYGGAQAMVTHETYADGGVKQTKFDIHGDARTIVDQLNRTTTQSFDKMGRVTQVNHTSGLVENFAYDGLGQQIKKWNNLLVIGAFYDPYTGATSTGSPEVATTDYDTQGRIVSQKDFGGDITSHSFTWNAGLTTANIGTFGGWTEVTTFANGRTSTENTDMLGRMISRNDLGNNTTSYTYDVAGRIKTSAVGGLTTTFNHFNTGQMSGMVTGTANAGTANTNWSRETASYTYDKLGQRLTEHLRHENAVYTPGQTIWYNQYEPDFIPATYNVTNTVVKNATAVFDALGRVTNWSEVGSTKTPAANTAYRYDATGNIRRTTATYKALDANGNALAGNVSKDYWFRFDSMNRMVIDRGTLSGGQIVRGNSTYAVQGGKEILYNKAGERTAVLTTNYSAGTFNPYTGFLPGTFSESRESYVYDLGGRLKQINVSTGTVVAESSAGSGVPAGAIPSAPINGTRRSAFSYDLMGRQTAQTDYEANGTTIAYSRSATYNSKNQLTADTTDTKRGSDIFRSTTSYNYGAGTSYALGSVVSQYSTNYKNNSSSAVPNSSTANTFYWRDGAVQATIKHKPNAAQSTQYTTTFYYDGMGRLTRAYVGDYYSQTVTFTNDENGQIIRRDETTTSNSTGAPHEVWYRYGGRQLGYTGNNGTSDVSTTKSIQERQMTPPTTPGVFRNGGTIGSSYADFANSYDPLNSYNQGAGGGSYTVNKGDTLQSIAQSVYGDANLWYKIAQLNGISGSVPLIEGQRINLPTGVVKSSHNSNTLKPYNPGEALGDLTPTTSAPPKQGKNKCGVFGAILLAVVAVAVTVVTAGAALAATGAVSSFASGLSTVLGTAVLGGTVTAGGIAGAASAIGAVAIGAASAAAGSIVSQGLGVATGIQAKFSWKAVGMAALGGGISAGIGPGGIAGGENGLFSGVGSKVVAAGLRGATTSAISQGIGVATGLQGKFSWAGVAAAGIGAAAGQAVSGLASKAGHGIAGGLGLTNGAYERTAAGITNALTGAAKVIANAATRSAIEGTSFRDNVIAAIPDVVASTLQSMASACFTGETLIQTPMGPKRIDEIRVGDLVYSRDDAFKDDSVHARRVLELYQFEDRATFDLTIAYPDREETFRATPEHPFALISAGHTNSVPATTGLEQGRAHEASIDLMVNERTTYSWRPAGELQSGDRVIDINGRAGMVVAIEPVGLTSTVHNFAVEGHHTYFVGETGTWVHNQYGAEHQAKIERITRAIALTPAELEQLTDLELALVIHDLSGVGSALSRSGNSELIKSYSDSALNIATEALSRHKLTLGAVAEGLRAGAWEGAVGFAEDTVETVKALGGLGLYAYQNPGEALSKTWNALADGASVAWNAGWDAAGDAVNYIGGLFSGETDLVHDVQAATQFAEDQGRILFATVALEASAATMANGIEGFTGYFAESLSYTLTSLAAGGALGKGAQVLGGAARSAMTANNARRTSRVAGAGGAALAINKIRTVTVNGFDFDVDDLGRTVGVRGQLSLNTAPRNTAAQRAAGGADRLPDDQGGHFAGSRFNGPGEAINLFAQNGNFNQSAYKILENEWARALDNGLPVSIDIRPVYSGTSLRPAAMQVRYTIDGHQLTENFVNRRGGR